MPGEAGIRLFFCTFTQILKTLMKVFIAGLPLEVDEAELTAVFGDFGPVKSLRIIKDRETKESKGFGFVEMVNEDEAKEAIRCMNGASYYGRRITVNVAEDKGPGFNGGGQKGGFRRN
ncbi:RNA recognition motif. (a.k.a. RRM, RBD, or RNP domain) [Mucilaginibacter sp. NFR10]|nr:RNA recognition motif. (a.k.a. RRM, RBD, or RNP domain) [Mucilaginibacter sp. NFR10]